MLLEARNAIHAALSAGSLPLSPTFEKRWKTTKQKSGGSANSLPPVSPLVTVVPVTCWSFRASEASHHYGAAIAIVVRAHAPTEERCDELSDFVEDVVQCVTGVVTDPPIAEVMVAAWVDLDRLNGESIWVSEIHAVIGLPKKGVAQ